MRRHERPTSKPIELGSPSFGGVLRSVTCLVIVVPLSALVLIVPLFLLARTSMLELLLGVLLGLLGEPFVCNVSQQIPFDSAKWKWERDVDCEQLKDVRHEMVKNLSENHYLKTGMTRDAVEKILGPPDRVYFRNEMSNPSPDIEEYWYYDLRSSCYLCSRFMVGFDDKGLYRQHDTLGQ